MDYLLRKFKFKHKRSDQNPPQMVVTSPQPMTSDGSSTSDRFEFELADRLPPQVNQVPQLSPKRVKLSDNCNDSNHQSLHSIHSSHSSLSRSSCSGDGPQQTNSDLSVVAKVCSLIIIWLFFCSQIDNTIPCFIQQLYRIIEDSLLSRFISKID